MLLMRIFFRPTAVIPPYLHRRNFIPRNPEDFGDGGAFPEIHIAQFPLNLGKPGATSSAIVSVDVDEKGEVRYDAIVRQGGNKEKQVQSTLDFIKERKGDEDLVALPAEDEEEKTAERTRLALEGILEGKIKKSKPSTLSNPAAPEEPTYIRYTPNPNAPG
jgi:SNW domain-containing protein 1